MKWHLYKKDDPSTWPKIDCPMLVYYGEDDYLFLSWLWDDEENMFSDENGYLEIYECYYAYIGYVPNGYKIHEVIKCMDDSHCPIGCNDDGYCQFKKFKCSQQKHTNEYTIEEKRIWKEFEEV